MGGGGFFPTVPVGSGRTLIPSTTMIIESDHVHEKGKTRSLGGLQPEKCGRVELRD